ncbi:MAG: GreA/GreB family elongation factor [Elusimicrobiota bacterium]
MSRAFVKEDSGEEDDLPDRPQPPGPNYVTPRGNRLLRERLEALAAERSRFPAGADDGELRRRRRMVEREIRYYRGRAETAVVVDHADNPPEDVRIGAEIEAADESGHKRRFFIVGHDEADPENGRISWASPLAGLLLGRKAGDEAVWKKPGGETRLRITAVRYTGDGGA